MARLRVPGGVLTPQQWLAAERIARERGNGTLRLTTRQTIQFHGIIKSNLRARDPRHARRDARHHRGLRRREPQRDRARQSVAKPRARRGGWRWRSAIGAHLLPKSRAWHEIWIDGEQITGGEEEDEPIYGRTYLPRKFKIADRAAAVKRRRCVRARSRLHRDRGSRPHRRLQRRGRRRHGHDARRAGHVPAHRRRDRLLPPDQAVDVAEKVVTVQRDFGDRSDRKHARLKYTIERMGLDGVPRRTGTAARLCARAGARLRLHRQWRSARLGAG